MIADIYSINQDLYRVKQQPRFVSLIFFLINFTRINVTFQNNVDAFFSITDFFIIKSAIFCNDFSSADEMTIIYTYNYDTLIDSQLVLDLIFKERFHFVLVLYIFSLPINTCAKRISILSLVP